MKVGAYIQKADPQIMDDALSPSTDFPEIRARHSIEVGIPNKEIPLELTLEIFDGIDGLFHDDEFFLLLQRFLTGVEHLRAAFLDTFEFKAFIKPAIDDFFDEPEDYEGTPEERIYDLQRELKTIYSPEERLLFIEETVRKWSEENPEQVLEELTEEAINFLAKLDIIRYQLLSLIHFTFPHIQKQFPPLREKLMELRKAQTNRFLQQVMANKKGKEPVSPRAAAGPSSPKTKNKGKKGRKTKEEARGRASSPVVAPRFFHYPAGPQVIEGTASSSSPDQALALRAADFSKKLKVAECQVSAQVFRNHCHAHLEMMRHLFVNGAQDSPKLETATLLFHGHQALQNALKYLLVENDESSAEFTHWHDLIYLAKEAKVFAAPGTEKAKGFLNAIRRMNEYWRYPADTYVKDSWGLNLARSMMDERLVPQELPCQAFENVLSCLEYIFSRGRTEALGNIHNIQIPPPKVAPNTNTAHYQHVLQMQTSDPFHERKIARRHQERLYFIHAWLEQELRKHVRAPSLESEHNLLKLFENCRLNLKSSEKRRLNALFTKLARANKQVEFLKDSEAQALRRRELASPFFGFHEEQDGSWTETSDPRNQAIRLRLLKESQEIFEQAQEAIALLKKQ